MQYDFEVREVAAVKVLVARATCAHDKIDATLRDIFPKVHEVMQERGLTMEGPPFSRYTDWRESDCDLEAGCPVSGEAPAEGEVYESQIPAARAATTVHRGPYEKLPEAHAALHNWVDENGMECDGPCWEIYLTDPDLEPDTSKWETAIFYPVR